MSQHDGPPPAIRAAGLSLRGGHGWVYRDVTLDVPAGGLTTIVGAGGSGRTGLLLTLGGRMRPAAGTLAVHGHTRPERIRRLAALGLVGGVNDLDDALSVRDHLHERLRPGISRLRRRRSPAGPGPAATALRQAGLEVTVLPDGDRTLVRHLGREQRLRLGIALALVDEPRVLLLDDVDAGLAADRRAALAATLRALTGDGRTVVATAAAPLAGPRAGTTVELRRPAEEES
ncbi:hypothetical protein Sru01_02780 [Sphaerisporangium rufum]|uniref:ABC transporter domain-containing protein n=1 Tax=Sphaerisporangium rufum TaxID=1381558 RepID=A0A919UVQ4_9ACTN|nr:ATP-binding cassette domain-containing protein [Sphaerisporangium rufum]GII75296.1 hypothetical protein Sru01_02780 [Sphaerisporangium rufum]